MVGNCRKVLTMSKPWPQRSMFPMIKPYPCYFAIAHYATPALCIPQALIYIYIYIYILHGKIKPKSVLPLYASLILLHTILLLGWLNVEIRVLCLTINTDAVAIQ